MTAELTPTLDTWLNQPWPVSILAVAGRDAHDTPFLHHPTPNVALSIRPECWQTMNEALAQLAAHGCGESESLWVFETALLWIARRTDGGWAGVVTPRELSESTIAALKTRLAQFVE
jgi:hypothetical protein